MRHWTGFASALALAALLSAALPSASAAFAGFGATADVGFGRGHLESASRQEVTSWGLGLGLPLGPAQWIELRSTGTGTPFSHGVSRADGSSRTIQTLTGGFHISTPIVLTAGLGVGRAESATREAVGAPLVLRERTGMAFTLGAGFRFANGIGPLGLEVAWRMHGLLEDDMKSSDFARLVTVGLSF